MGEKISNNEVLNSFNAIADYFQYFFEDDITIAITDKEKFIMNRTNSNLPMNSKTGDKVPDGGAIREALKTGRPIIKDVPEKVYGIPFKSYAIPVKDEQGSVAGCFVLGKSLAKKKELIDIAKALNSSFNQISLAISNVSAGVQKVADMNSEISNRAQDAEASSKDTDAILNFIQGVSSKTNMLGLNAAIEASRAGEAGRGFNVVASEIRKLSASTSESIKKIDSVLKNISGAVVTINEKITKSNEVFNDEAATLQQIIASLGELNDTARTLEKLAERI